MAEASLNIQAWQVLAALAEGGGFRAAALKADIDLPAASRLLRRLEDDLGVQLADRRSRPVTLTPQALSIIPAARALVEDHERLMNSIGASAGQPRDIFFGIPVNISRGSTFVQLKRYRGTDPGLNFVISSDNNHEDVLQGVVDAAYLPYRPKKEDGLVLWSIARTRNCLLAAPSYLERRGVPRTPAELAGHDIILRSAKIYPVTRTLTDGKETVPLEYRRIAFSGDVPSGREALLAGEGISIDLSFGVCMEEVLDGRLVPVLLPWHRPPWQLTLAVSRKSAGDLRLMRFCRWYVVQERKAVAARQMDLQRFIEGRLAGAGS